MAYQFPPSSGFGRFNPYGQNKSYMQYLQKIANRIQAERLLEEEAAAQQAPVAEFSETSYQTDPEMPYLSGLSPMARYRDMGLRQQGRQLQGVPSPAEQQLQQDAAMGVTRQPDGRITTEAGATIFPEQMGQRTVATPYGTASAMRSTGPSRGTFSFQTADGSTVTAPMSSMRNPKFMKFMREEELGRAAANTPQKKKSSDLSFEDIMSQIDSVR